MFSQIAAQEEQQKLKNVFVRFSCHSFLRFSLDANIYSRHVISDHRIFIIESIIGVGRSSEAVCLL